MFEIIYQYDKKHAWKKIKNGDTQSLYIHFAHEHVFSFGFYFAGK